MFQDAAGTIPVTATGQPVGRINDKSGRSNHATQATAASRPLLQQAGGFYYLDFDGVDDSLSAAAVPLTNTTQHFAVAYLLDVTTANFLLDYSDDAAGDFWVLETQFGGDTRTRFSDGTLSQANAVAASPISTKLLCDSALNSLAGTAAGTIQQVVNGGAPTSGNGLLTGNGLPARNLIIGKNAGSTVLLNGRVYSVCAINRALSGPERTSLLAFMQVKLGA
jgi:hypothetical protein